MTHEMKVVFFACGCLNISRNKLESKLADLCLGQFCSLNKLIISEKYNNLIHVYFFLRVIHKYYITQMMETGQWYNYLVIYDIHKPSPLAMVHF